MEQKNTIVNLTIDRQPVVNIGVIGHVAHGKSTFVKNITGVKTQRHSSELVNNKTVYLGYANTKIYQCPNCPKPKCYSTNPQCEGCQGTSELVNHISFVDCPGHDDLMATMLNGVSLMDYVVLVIAANEQFPMPQTLEHFLAAKIMGVRNRKDRVEGIQFHPESILTERGHEILANFLSMD